MSGFQTYCLYPTDMASARYERLREQYATGLIELEEFTAGVVTLLRAGL